MCRISGVMCQIWDHEVQIQIWKVHILGKYIKKVSNILIPLSSRVQ